MSFSVKAGQALAVEGANGAGKTSLLRLIAGFLAPDAGRILVKTGAGESDDGEERGRLVGWLGHQDGLKPQLMALEQLAFFARLYAVRDAKLPSLLAEVGLARQAELPCRYLSAPARNGVWRWRGCWFQSASLAAGRALRGAGQHPARPWWRTRWRVIARRAASSSPPPMIHWASAMKA